MIVSHRFRLFALAFALLLSLPAFAFGGLIDGSFEGLETGDLEDINEIFNGEKLLNVWGIEDGDVVGAEPGVSPRTGAKMMRLNRPVATASTEIQIQQRIEVDLPASWIDTGLITLDFTSFFDVPNGTPDAIGSAKIAYVGESTAGNLVLNALKLTELTTGVGGIDPNDDWEELGIAGDQVPEGTRSVLVELSFLSDSLSGDDVGYVDDVSLRFSAAAIPEPTSLMLFSLGFCLVAFKRKRFRLIR